MMGKFFNSRWFMVIIFALAISAGNFPMMSTVFMCALFAICAVGVHFRFAEKDNDH